MFNPECNLSSPALPSVSPNGNQGACIALAPKRASCLSKLLETCENACALKPTDLDRSRMVCVHSFYIAKWSLRNRNGRFRFLPLGHHTRPRIHRLRDHAVTKAKLVNTYASNFCILVSCFQTLVKFLIR